MMTEKKKSLIPYSLDIRQNDAEMSLSDHLEELRQRAFWSVSILLTSIILCVFSVKNIVKILQSLKALFYLFWFLVFFKCLYF